MLDKALQCRRKTGLLIKTVTQTTHKTVTITKLSCVSALPLQQLRYNGASSWYGLERSERALLARGLNGVGVRHDKLSSLEVACI